MRSCVSLTCVRRKKSLTSSSPMASIVLCDFVICCSVSISGWNLVLVKWIRRNIAFVPRRLMTKPDDDKNLWPFKLEELRHQL